MAGLRSLFSAFWLGIFLLAAAALLPPAHAFIERKTRIALASKVRVSAVSVLFIISALLNSHEPRTKAAVEQQARAKAKQLANRERANYFGAHREDVVSSVRQALEEQHYDAALAEANKYSVANDETFKQL